MDWSLAVLVQELDELADMVRIIRDWQRHLRVFQ